MPVLTPNKSIKAVKHLSPEPEEFCLRAMQLFSMDIDPDVIVI